MSEWGGGGGDGRKEQGRELLTLLFSQPFSQLTCLCWGMTPPITSCAFRGIQAGVDVGQPTIIGMDQSVCGAQENLFTWLPAFVYIHCSLSLHNA